MWEDRLSVSTITRNSRRIRLWKGGYLISEVPTSVGPTHGFFDLLAAAVVTLAPGPQVAALGFGAGGFVAPLRALGGSHVIEGVDRLSTGYRLFEKTLPSIDGVRFHRADASRWLRTRRRLFDVVVEDLSQSTRLGPVKPRISTEVLPGLIRRRLQPRGVVITTLLPTPGWSWTSLAAAIRDTSRKAAIVQFCDLENRVLLCSSHLPPIPRLAQEIRSALRSIGSKRCRGISIRGLTTHDHSPQS